METKTVSLAIDGMHCTSCAINIDLELEDLKGVKKANTHYARQQISVTYEPDSIDVDDIISVITKLGYSAQLLS